MNLRKTAAERPLTFTVGKERLFSMQWERKGLLPTLGMRIPAFYQKNKSRYESSYAEMRHYRRLRDSKQKDLASIDRAYRIAPFYF